MSVDYQDDIAEDWDMAEAMPKSDANGDGAHFSNLNEALDQAGSILGDMSAQLPIAFRFDWHKMAIFCQIVDQDGDAVLKLTADLGPMPFTIENKDRRSYLKHLHSPAVGLPIGRFLVTDRRRFRHCIEHPLSSVVNGSNIVTAVVQSLLTARPYYELAKKELR